MPVGRHPWFLPLPSDDDTSVSALPMVHIAGLMIGLCNPLAQGARVVTLPRFEPLTFLQAVQQYKVGKSSGLKIPLSLFPHSISRGF